MITCYGNTPASLVIAIRSPAFLAGYHIFPVTEPSITESDAEELKSHLLDLIDSLKDAGLDDLEAFLVASKRMAKTDDWGKSTGRKIIPFFKSEDQP